MHASTQFELRLLGPFTLSPSPPTAPLRRKTRALIAYLAATGVPHTRQQLMTLFCQEAQAPSRALSVLLSRVRKRLGKGVLQAIDGRVALNPDAVRLDMTAYVDILDCDLNRRSADELQTAVELYRGDFLEGLSLDDAPEFELWLLSEQARLRHLYERGLLTLVQTLLAHQKLEQAFPFAQGLVQHNPLLEEGHALLMQLYMQRGQREAALQQYARCRQLLHSELAVSPSPALQQLHDQLLAGHKDFDSLRPQAANQSQIAQQPLNFIGRQKELNQLHAAWQAARRGHGRLILLSAPAGSGKSALLDRFLHAFERSDVLKGHAYESTRTLPYYPWLEILNTHLQRLNTGALERLSPATRSAISRLLPEIHPVQAPAAAQPSDHFSEPARLYLALVDFLAHPHTTPPHPYLIILEDVHWADESSLLLLHHITQRLPHLPFLLVVSARTSEMAENPSLYRLLDELSEREQVSQLSLNPLTKQEIEHLILARWPNLSKPERTGAAARMLTATGGNALFITAILQEFTVQQISGATLPVPRSVRTLIKRRLGRLQSGGRQVLETLAVLGGPASLPKLLTISARGEEETAQALDWGMRWGVISSQTDTGVTTYDFQHDLVRDAVLAALSTARRQRLHKRSAEWLVSRAGRLTELQQRPAAGQIVYHAQRAEAFTLIFEWAPLAAAHYRQVCAYRDGLEMLEWMRDAFVQLRLRPEFNLDAAEISLFEGLLWWLSYAWMVGREVAEMQTVLRQAEGLLARHPSPKREAQLQLTRARLSPQFMERIPEALAARDRFLTLGELGLAAEALVTAASASITISRNSSGRHLYAQALDLTRRLDDHAGEARVLNGLAWTALNLGETAVALTYLEEALQLSLTQEDKLGEAEALFGLAAAWGFYHAADQMTASAQAAKERFLEIGFAGQALRPELYLGFGQAVRGEWHAALAIYTAVLPQALAAEDGWLAGWLAQMAGRIYLRQGALKAAAEKLEQARRLRVRAGERQNQISDLVWHARLQLAQGGVPAALAKTLQALEMLEEFQGEFYVWEQPDIWMCRAETLSAAGESAAAEAALTQAQAELHRFAAQISDPDLRAQYVAYPLNARIETAVVKQQIALWPAA